MLQDVCAIWHTCSLLAPCHHSQMHRRRLPRLRSPTAVSMLVPLRARGREHGTLHNASSPGTSGARNVLRQVDAVPTKPPSFPTQSLGRTALASPEGAAGRTRSPSLNAMVCVRKMFSGFMSRCMTWRACRAASARRSGATICARLFGAVAQVLGLSNVQPMLCARRCRRGRKCYSAHSPLQTAFRQGAKQAHDSSSTAGTEN